jgi:hypothetical protein
VSEPELGSAEKVGSEWVFRELVRIEQHWTDQMQNQQARIATILATSGIMLSFLAPIAFNQDKLRAPHWSVILPVMTLALSLLFGLLALFPWLPPQERRFIELEWFLEQEGRFDLPKLNKSFVENPDGPKANEAKKFLGIFRRPSTPLETVAYRRTLVILQLALLAATGVTLLIALIYSL